MTTTTLRPPGDPAALDPATVLERYVAAKARRVPWEGYWQECYDYALPLSVNVSGIGQAADRRGERLFDGTAIDAVDQLASSLLAQLTPPWSRWFGLEPGPDLGADERERMAPGFERMSAIVQSHFDRSNFIIEMHQCFLELATVGTASLLVEENPPGEPSCLRFTAVPMAEMVLEEGPGGRLDTSFRRSELSLAALSRRFPNAALPDPVRGAGANARFTLIEAVLPDGPAYRYVVVLENAGSGPVVLAEGRFGQSPFINFRWLKAPGESYGRSPVMKALPDIKTANKVVELVLKNASMVVSGMWQADDDGVLNPSTIRLVPGAIIPKATGSAGLTPLANPGRFDVSQLVLNDLRARIRHALLADTLGPVSDARMTATEVLERSAEMARLLGATYGRLQSELLTPLLLRAFSILRRRGEIPDVSIDGRLVELKYRSPLARAQATRDVGATLQWLEAAVGLGPQALAAVDLGAAARWLGEAFGVPGRLIIADASGAALPPLPLPDAAEASRD
ncbi:MAG: portal protein [Rhodospirillaceae bacterium]